MFNNDDVKNEEVTTTPAPVQPASTTAEPVVEEQLSLRYTEEQLRRARILYGKRNGVSERNAEKILLSDPKLLEEWLKY